MSFNKNIKSDALILLKNNLIKVIGITLVWGLIFCLLAWVETTVHIINNIDDRQAIDIFNNLIFGKHIKITLSNSLIIFVITSLIISLIYCCVISVLKMGEINWSYLTIYQKTNDFSNIFNYFSCFKNILKSWYVSCQIFFRKIFWSIIIFFIPMLVSAWSLLATTHQNLVANKYLISFGYILSFFLIIISSLICLIFFQRYMLTRYLLVSGECKKTREAIKLSIKIMKNKKLDYIFLLISFSGWIISCLFIVPIFFVFPYVKITIALYSRYIIEEYNQKHNN